MDSATGPRPLDSEDAQPALAESTLSAPVLPGPNVFMAFVWWLVFMAAQIVTGVAVMAMLVAVTIIRFGPKLVINSIDDLPGGFVVMFFAGTGGNLLVSSAIVAILFRANAGRVIALRWPSAIHLGLVALIALPMALVGGQVQAIASHLLPSFHFNDAAYVKLAEQPWFLVVLLGCVLPALGEELFFRGFLSRGLLARHGPFWGVFAASLLFGLIHIDPPQVVATAALAVAFQFVFFCTKSLCAPIFFHALNNFMAFAVMRLASIPVIRDMFGLADSSFIPPIPFAAAALAAAGIAWLLFETRTRWTLQDGQIWSPGYVTAETPPPNLAAVARMASPPPRAVIFAVLSYLVFIAVIAREIGRQ